MILLKSSFIYLISNIVNAAIPFLLLPILTRYLSPAEYGRIAMFQVLLFALVAFVGINSSGAAARYYYDNDSTEDLVKYNVSCFWLLFISTALTLLVTFLFNDQISKLLSIPTLWIYTAVMISFFIYIINFRLTQWQIRNEAKKYGLMQISRSAIDMALSLCFVMFLAKQAQGRIDAQLIASFFVSTIALVSLFKSSLMKFKLANKRNIKDAFKFGFPLIPHVFGAFLLTNIDRVIIKNEINIESAGVYLLGFQISLGLSVFFDAINKAYVPWLYESLSKNKADIKIKIVINTYKYFILLWLIAIVGFILAPKLVLYLVGSEFEQVSDIISWLLLGQIFGGMYLMVANYIFYSKKTTALSMITILTAVLNVCLLYFLIPLFSIKGAAYAFCISCGCRFILVWILSQRLMPMPWSLNARGYYE